MSEGQSWSRQKSEIDAYNAFLSAYHSRNSYHGFSRHGFRLTNYFPTIDNRFTDDSIKPDFSLYDGESLILAEVKYGNNIEKRDIKQAERLNSVSIDAAEEFIDKVDVEERFGLSGEVYSVEPLIYYDGLDSDYVENCRHEWPNCKKRLEKLENHCAVLGRESDYRLQLMAGEFDSPDFTSWMEYGVKMAENPRVSVTMTDGLEIESIAVSLCTIWGQRAVSAPISVKVSEMRQHFNYRDLEPQRVQSAFDLLDELDACDRRGKREIEFTPEHMPEILDIERLLKERGGGGEQGDLADFL